MIEYVTPPRPRLGEIHLSFVRLIKENNIWQVCQIKSAHDKIRFPWVEGCLFASLPRSLFSRLYLLIERAAGRHSDTDCAGDELSVWVSSIPCQMIEWVNSTRQTMLFTNEYQSVRNNICSVKSFHQQWRISRRSIVALLFSNWVNHSYSKDVSRKHAFGSKKKSIVENLTTSDLDVLFR